MCVLDSALWHTRQRAHLHQLHAWPYSTRHRKVGCTDTQGELSRVLEADVEFFCAQSVLFLLARIRPPDPFDAQGDGATRAMAAAPAAACAEECQASASQAQGDGRGDPDADGLYCAARRHSLSRPGWSAITRDHPYLSLMHTHSAPRLPSCMCELSERVARPSCR